MNWTAVFDNLPATLASVALAVLPLLSIFTLFQLWMLKLPWKYFLGILKGTLLASAGLALFLQGVQISFLPFGRAIGEALGSLPNQWLIVSLGVLLGFLTSLSEPSVRILADQVEKASSGSIRRSTVIGAVCTGVALFVGLGMVRILHHIPLLYILIPGYGLVMVLLWFIKGEYLSIAIDAGGVATGPMANTFLLALALGVSSSIGDRDPVIHGFGLVALIALAPILSLIGLGLLLAFKRRPKAGEKEP